MSLSRPENEEVKSSITLKDFVRPTIQTVLTGVTVATVLLPFEVLQTRKQLNSSFIIPKMGLFPWLATLSYAIKASMVKNLCISNHETVHGQVAIHVDAITGKESAHGVKETNYGEIDIHEGFYNDVELISPRRKLAATFGTSIIIGSIDTSFTNYFANMRVWNAVHGSSPVFPTVAQQFQASTVGFAPRLTRNFLCAFFCIGTTTLKDPIDRLLPPTDYRILNPLLATVMGGGISGVVTNGIDVVYKHKVAATDLQTLESPGSLQVAKNLVAKEGARALTKGSFFSVIYSVLAFGAINTVDWFMNSYLYVVGEEDRKNKLRNNNKIFKADYPTTIQDVVEEDKKVNKPASGRK